MSIKHLFITDPKKASSNTAAGVVFIISFFVLHNYFFTGNEMYPIIVSFCTSLAIGTLIYFASEFLRKKSVQ